MFNRKIRHNIPDWTDKINKKKMNENLQENDKNSKYKSKHYMDNKHHSTNRAMKIGDRVLVKQRKLNKLTPTFNPQPYTVIQRNGYKITAKREISNHNVKRNISYFKLILRTVPTIPKIKEEEEMSIFENQEPTLNQPLPAGNE